MISKAGSQKGIFHFSSISPFPERSHSPTPPHHQWVKDTDGDDVNGHNDDDGGGEDGDDDGYDVVDDVDDDGGSLGMWVGSVERWCSSLGRVRPDSFLLPPPDHREHDEDDGDGDDDVWG